MITIRFLVRFRVIPNRDNYWTITDSNPHLIMDPWLGYERFPE